MGTTLVTGAAGFVGQHLLRELASRGGRVVGATLDGSAPAPGVLSATELEAVHWTPVDLRDPGSVAAVVDRTRPDRVFHLAAQSSVGASFRDVLGTWDVNATGTLRLLHALAERAPGARVLLVSSSEVYGAVAAEAQPIREARAVRPASPYAASKAAAELVGLQYAAANAVQVVITRSFNHIGPGQSPRFAVASWAEQLRRIAEGTGAPILRVGNLDVRRDLLDVRDVVRAYGLLMERGENGGVYNVCSGEARSLREVIGEMIALSGTGATVELDPDRLRPVDLPLLLGDPTRLRALGWRPEVPLTRTLKDLLAVAGAAAPEA